MWRASHSQCNLPEQKHDHSDSTAIARLATRIRGAGGRSVGGARSAGAQPGQVGGGVSGGVAQSLQWGTLAVLWLDVPRAASRERAEVRALQDQQGHSRGRLEAGFQALLQGAVSGEL